MWYQEDTNNHIRTLSYTAANKEWALELEVAAENANSGTTLAAITWDSGTADAASDRMVRIFYIDNTETLAERHWSLVSGWKNIVMSNLLNMPNTNPIVVVRTLSNGGNYPFFEWMKTGSKGNIVNGGNRVRENSTDIGYDVIWTGEIKYAQVESVKYPLAVASMDIDNGAESLKKYRIFYHAEGNRLWRLYGIQSKCQSRERLRCDWCSMAGFIWRARALGPWPRL